MTPAQRAARRAFLAGAGTAIVTIAHRRSFAQSVPPVHLKSNVEACLSAGFTDVERDAGGNAVLYSSPTGVARVNCR